MLIIVYLVAIVAANLSIATFGPQSAIINAFLFIGLDITTRDRLHDRWQDRQLWARMGALIAAGSLLSWLVNRNAGPIALASFVAFVAAGLTDTVAYRVLFTKPWFIRVNGSNVVSAAVDSVVFPWLAFGTPIWWVVVGQFVAKVLGGAVWSVILRRSINTTEVSHAFTRLH